MTQLDRYGPIPPCEQIAEFYRQRIATGRMLPYTPMPTVTAIATEFGVARSTARRALQRLQDEGLVSVPEATRIGAWVRP